MSGGRGAWSRSPDAVPHTKIAVRIVRILFGDADRGDRSRVFRLRTEVTDMGSPAEDPGAPNGKAPGRRRVSHQHGMVTSMVG